MTRRRVCMLAMSSGSTARLREVEPEPPRRTTKLQRSIHSHLGPERDELLHRVGRGGDAQFVGAPLPGDADFHLLDDPVRPQKTAGHTAEAGLESQAAIPSQAEVFPSA